METLGCSLGGAVYKVLPAWTGGQRTGDAGSIVESRWRLCSGGAVEDGPEAFREQRRGIEGPVYPALQAQMDAPEPSLKA